MEKDLICQTLKIEKAAAQDLSTTPIKEKRVDLAATKGGGDFGNLFNAQWGGEDVEEGSPTKKENEVLVKTRRDLDEKPQFRWGVQEMRRGGANA